MLHLVYGGDGLSRKMKYQKQIDDAIKSGAVFVAMSDVEFNYDFVKMSSSGNDLFSQKYIVLLNSVLSNKELNTESIFEILPELASSENIFIFSEESALKDIVKKFEKVKADISDCGTKVKQGKERFNTFALSDSFGARDRKMSWIIFTKAISHNIAPEELSGVLFWAVKGMILSHKETNLGAAETGLSPFVYQKSKQASSHFTLSELEDMSTSLVSLYHRAHRGEVDFETGLELFLLKQL